MSNKWEDYGNGKKVGEQWLGSRHWNWSKKGHDFYKRVKGGLAEGQKPKYYIKGAFSGIFRLKS